MNGPYGSDVAPGWEKGLLIRRSIAQPHELAFYLTHATDGTALADLVQVAGARWTIEACFPPRTGLRPAGDPGVEVAKGEVGLERYEVCSWTGWHRHVTLAMLAHAYLAALLKVAVGGGTYAGPRSRPPAAHRPGGPPPALASRLAAHALDGGGTRLVTLATTPPAVRTTMSLTAPYQQ